MFDLVASATILQNVSVPRGTSYKMVSAPLLRCDRSAFAPLLLRSRKICIIAAVEIPFRRIMFNLNVLVYE